MFNKRTIFILGAGASSEANLPTGAQLIPLIRQKLNFRSSLSNHHQSRQRRLKSGDAAIAHAIEEHCKQHKHDDFAKCYAAGRFIHRGLLTSTSIDDFLDVHRDDKYVQFCGKLAIVQSILEAERNSLFSFDFESDALQFETLADSWFLQFIRLLRQGIPSADRDRIFENVGFINFNYDRCLEYFIYHALRQGYGLNAVATSELLGRLRIVHPYGSVGKLKSWDGEAGIDFGADEYDLPNLAAGIKIYTVAFMAPDKGKALLKFCASTDANYYEPNTMDALTAAFSSIGEAATKSTSRLTN